ncbi:hypothetical protein HRbin01_00755 [archaeon HR01]|nr:hypothetical protein HRbin01_00755 [archaeon HR01]
MSSAEFLVKEARRRAEVFRNLRHYLERLADVIARLDPSAEVYLFGSVAENRHLLSSDIDILVVSEKKPGEVLAELWRKGFGDPFEVHVVAADALEDYRRRTTLVKINQPAEGK